MANNADSRTRSQIEADLGATRDRLTASVEALIDQVHPNRIKQRQIAGVKRFVDIEVETAKSLIFNARGDLRTDRLALIGGGGRRLRELPGDRPRDRPPREKA